MLIRLFVFGLLLLFVPRESLAQPADALLFDSHEVLQLTMPVDFDALCRPSEEPDCGYTPTELRYRAGDGSERTVPISIRRRDGWRAQQTNCQVPTLFVRFAAEDAIGSPFEGQPELALTSHCGKGIAPGAVSSRALPDMFESYVINEYLGYRLYNLVTDASLRVRLTRMTYVDPDDSRRSFTRDAFFSEHFDSLASRLGATVVTGQGFDPQRLDLRAADELALFHYMVGNTDWSIEDQDNVILLEFPDGNLVPVLFDLDLSGLVDAHYARPTPGLPIRDVRQRYYLGFCHSNTDWEALFTKFRSLRDDIITMLVQTPGYGRGERRRTGVYLDSFFSVLGSEKARSERIMNACRPLPG